MTRERENPSRFHSLALGKFDNFKAATAGVIAVGDSSPSVGLYSILYADTAGNLTIDQFLNGSEGQLVLVINRNSGAVSFSGTNIYTSDSSALAQNDCALFVKNTDKWYEISKSHCASSDVAIYSSNETAITVTNKRMVIMAYNNTPTLTTISGGVEGQTVILATTKSSVTLDNAAACFINARSSQDYVLVRSDAVTITKVNGLWVGLGYPATGL